MLLERAAPDHLSRLCEARRAASAPEFFTFRHADTQPGRQMRWFACKGWRAWWGRVRMAHGLRPGSRLAALQPSQPRLGKPADCGCGLGF